MLVGPINFNQGRRGFELRQRPGEFDQFPTKPAVQGNGSLASSQCDVSAAAG
jgi:hypothetical protein